MSVSSSVVCTSSQEITFPPFSSLYHNRFLQEQFLQYGVEEAVVESISKALLAEGMLSRTGKSVVGGSILLNGFDAVLRGQWEPNVRFFTLPTNQHQQRLKDYRTFYSAFKPKYSVGWILRTYLPDNYPFCDLLILNFLSNSSGPPLDAEYDQSNRRFTLNIRAMDCDMKVEECPDMGGGYIFPSFDPLLVTVSPTELLSDQPTDARPDLIKEWGKIEESSCGPKLITTLRKQLVESRDEQNANDYIWEFTHRLCTLAAVLTKGSTKASTSAVGIPLYGFSMNRQQLMGVIWIVYDHTWQEMEDSGEISILGDMAKNILQPISGKLQTLLVTRQAQLLRVAENRSAAAAILARNMSHNIGSHVTPRAKLENLKQRIKKFLILSEWWSGKNWNVAVFPILEELNDKLSDYVQRKAEFIAEFSTDPLISTKGAWLFKDVILPFICNTVLIDTLAANEGLQYLKFDQPGLVIRCFNKDKTGEVTEIFPQFAPEWGEAEALDWTDLDTDKRRGAPYGLRNPEDPASELISHIAGEEFDVRVALPGPVGEMAIYGILENIIRNAAKHGAKQGKTGSNGQDRLEIHIVFEHSGQDQIKVRIYDNLTKDPRKENGRDQSLIDKIKGLIDKELIEPSGEVRKEAWGLAEMRLCADLLHGQAPGETSAHPNLLVDSEPADNRFIDQTELEQRRLGYSFHMFKALTAVFFGFTVDAAVQNQLENHGFRFKPIEDLFKQRPVGSPLSAFQFAVINSDALSDADSKWLAGEGENQDKRAGGLHQLPYRLILSGAKDVSAILGAVTTASPPFNDQQSPDDKHEGCLTDWLWQTWLDHLGKNQSSAPLSVDLYLQQGATERPTKELAEKALEYNTKAGQKRYTPAVMCMWGDGAGGVSSVPKNPEPPRHKGRRVIIDRHGNYLAEAGYPPTLDDRLLVIDKASQDFEFLYHPSFTEPWTLPYEIAEAGLLRILILDERIAQECEKEYSGSGGGKPAFQQAFVGQEEQTVRIWHIAERAGVYVATHLSVGGASAADAQTFVIAKGEWQSDPSAEATDKRPRLAVHFDASNADFPINAHRCLECPKTQAAKKWDKEGLPKTIINDIDIVVIHQGILDRMNDKIAGSGDEFSQELRQKCRLIVESGRGIPPEVQKTKDRFISYSLIGRAFQGGRVAKLGLTRTLIEAVRNTSA